MIDQMQADEIARRYVNKLAAAAGDGFEVIFEQAIEVEDGWVYFFNTSDYIKTNDLSAALAGNGPIYIRKNSEVHQLPSSSDWSQAIAQIK